MGAYENYLKRKSVNKVGKTVEEKVDAAMDMMETHEAVVERVRTFLVAYQIATEKERQYIAECRAAGRSDAFIGRVERRVQEVATTGEGDDSKPKLLLDDLKILLEGLR